MLTFLFFETYLLRLWQQHHHRLFFLFKIIQRTVLKKVSFRRCHSLLPPVPAESVAQPLLPQLADQKSDNNKPAVRSFEDCVVSSGSGGGCGFPDLININETSQSQNEVNSEDSSIIPVPVIIPIPIPFAAPVHHDYSDSSNYTEAATKTKLDQPCRTCHSRADSGFVERPVAVIFDLLNSPTSAMSIEEKFQAAVKVIQSLPNDGPYQPSNDTKLKFYGLYKQATDGPCNVPKPAFYDVIGKYKWNAWKQNGSMSKEAAMAKYVDGLKEIVETMSFNGDVQEFLDSIGPFYEFVNLQGAEMNHIKDKIDTITSSSSGSNSNVTSGRSSIAPSPINSCPNSPLRNAPEEPNNDEADGSASSVQREDIQSVMLETGTAQIQVESRTATYETSHSQTKLPSKTSGDESLSNSKHSNSNGDIKTNGQMSPEDERLTMNDGSPCSTSTAQDTSKTAPPPTPQHRRSSKTYQNVLGSVDETTVSSNGDALASDYGKVEEEDEIMQRMGPPQNQGQVTFSATCKEDLEHPASSSFCNNNIHKNKRGSWIGSRDTLPSTTSGTESEKYYSGDSEPELDERYAKFFSHQQQGINNATPGPSSAVHIQGSPPSKSSVTKVTSNGSSGGGSGTVRTRREKSSPKGSLGGLNQFVNATASGGDLVLQSTVERLNRDVDHILARLRILEALYATSSNIGIENSRNRRRRFFEGLSNANVAFIVMWPFAVHFLIKLVSWWWRRRRINRALLKAVVECGSKRLQ